LVNLSSTNQPVNFDYNDGFGPTLVNQVAHTAVDTYGNIDSFSGDVRQIWLTTANDVFFGSDTGNFASGDLGDDLLVGGTGADLLVGGEGNDTIDGGLGINTVAYNYDFGRDITTRLGVGVNLQDTGDVNFRGQSLYAGHAIDAFDDTDTLSNIQVVVGTGYADSIWGQTSHSTTMFGGAGADSLVGGDVGDTLIGDIGNDTLDGAGGTDTVDYTREAINNSTGWPINGPGATRHGVVVNLSNATITVAGETIAAGTAIDTFGSTDTLISIETIVGSEFADHIVGSLATYSIDGGDGDDVLVAGDGTGTMHGDDGDDTFVYKIGPVGTATIDDFTQDEDVIDLRAFASLFTSWDDLKATIGTAGHIPDGSVAMNGFDTVITFDDGSNSLTIKNIDFHDLNDADFDFGVVTGLGTADSLTGSYGDDSLDGANGNDTLVGLDGNDTLQGGTGTDSMVGGLGDDLYFVDSASDIVENRRRRRRHHRQHCRQLRHGRGARQRRGRDPHSRQRAGDPRQGGDGHRSRQHPDRQRPRQYPQRRRRQRYAHRRRRHRHAHRRQRRRCVLCRCLGRCHHRGHRHRQRHRHRPLHRDDRNLHARGEHRKPDPRRHREHQRHRQRACQRHHRQRRQQYSVGLGRS